MPGEVLGDRLMSETSILVDAALDDTQTKLVRQTLASRQEQTPVTMTANPSLLTN